MRREPLPPGRMSEQHSQVRSEKAQQAGRKGFNVFSYNRVQGTE